jgi:colanic acid/amylovoran biosynthesis protein
MLTARQFVSKAQTALSLPGMSPNLLLVAGTLSMWIRPVTRTSGPRVHILIAPPGGGNLGDQAMVEAFIESMSDSVLVVTRGERDLVEASTDSARYQSFPHLIYGSLWGYLKDLKRLKQVLATAESVSIVGADVMDGGYSYRSSANRANLAYLTQRLGIPTKVLGFSWNAAPDRRAKRALRRATATGVQALLRDPVSARRARADGIHNVVEVADLVFGASESSSDIAHVGIQNVLDTLKPIALINVSGLIDNKFDQTADYTRVIEHLSGLGFAIVILPHVSRSHDDDFRAGTKLLDALPDPLRQNVAMVDKLLLPRDIRALAKRAALTVTGRMHLAIMSLGCGTPAITISTQGKVEGLMELFGTPELSVTPKPGMGQTIIGSIDQIVSPGSDIVTRIASALPRVRERALMNYGNASSDRTGNQAPRATTLGR